ncbi:MAG: hypothetical protein A2Y25_05160 [Candidatus Melainabacteria bacterium GWF2_37_15]|nr:MAG: hypothetical protein A2Y25_05160 [Candidatus Melainabacteria bacterium GWF2_37_15]
MYEIASIKGKSGPYNRYKPEGWGRNANYNFKNFNHSPIDQWNPKFEIHYSKPDNFIVKAFKKLFKRPQFNTKSLLGYAHEDLKGFDPRVKKHPEIAPVDTDNDGKISVAEDAAFTLFQDALDTQSNDIDGKITNTGFINSMGMLFGKSKNLTKEILTEIRHQFNLDNCQ